MPDPKKQSSEKASYPDNRTAGLKRYPKGENGSSKGKTKGSKDGARAQLLRAAKKLPPKLLKDRIKAEGLPVTSKNIGDGIAEIVALKAYLGDEKFIKIFYERTESPLPRALQITDADGESLGSKIILMNYEDMPKEVAKK